ncbi:MAG: hypothetical protein K0S41_1676 [Anaerocolumna sp.]|nr:hypothetical protein [Anaerocolumna sp.]
MYMYDIYIKHAQIECDNVVIKGGLYETKKIYIQNFFIYKKDLDIVFNDGTALGICLSVPLYAYDQHYNGF